MMENRNHDDITCGKEQVVDCQQERLGFPRLHEVLRHPLPMPAHPLKKGSDVFRVPVVNRFHAGILDDDPAMTQASLLA